MRRGFEMKKGNMRVCNQGCTGVNRAVTCNHMSDISYTVLVYTEANLDYLSATAVTIASFNKEKTCPYHPDNQSPSIRWASDGEIG